MLSLVDVGAHGDNAADAVRVRLGGPGARGVHDTVLGAAQEVGAASEAIQHAAALSQHRIISDVRLGNIER